jgi:cyclophilin family peptidyl-prolyl cis-trans isomerase
MGIYPIPCGDKFPALRTQNCFKGGFMKKVLVLSLVLLFAFVSCGKKEVKKEELVKVALDKTNMADTIQKLPDFVSEKNPVVVIETDLGNMEMEVSLKETPKTAQNFLKLVSAGFYDSLIFHRVIADFVIQGGDPLGDGGGGPGYYINDEIGMKHKLGSVGMATSGPNTAGSQFYVCLKDLPQLDKNYTVFGRIISGMDVAQKIAKVKTDANDMPLQKVYMKKVYIKQI